MPKISVICAIYNAKKTIRRCLDSIRNQTFKDFELILVDDGSTDNSGKVCDKYAAQDNRIHVIHKKNEGVGAARACGLAHATGDYIIHVDPDDWIEQNALALLYNTAIEKIAAITICDFQLYTPYGKEIIAQRPSRMDSLGMMNDILDGKLLGGVCNKLIRNNIGGDFLSGIDYCEDVLYLAQICSKNLLRVAYVNEPLYNYDKSAANSITSGKVTREKYKSQLAFYRELKKVLPNMTDTQKSIIVGKLSIKAFANDFLTPREFYADLHKERKYIRLAKINQKLKPLILLSTFGLYLICHEVYKIYIGL